MLHLRGTNGAGVVAPSMQQEMERARQENVALEVTRAFFGALDDM